MIRRLQPFHANVQKRLTKSPKLYVREPVSKRSEPNRLKEGPGTAFYHEHDGECPQTH
jgi:predicted AAA+ superfamily ATPase